MTKIPASEAVRHPRTRIAAALLLAGLFGLAGVRAPTQAQVAPDLNDIPDKPAPADSRFDYEKRVVMIPMRDGVKLYTVMLIPKGAHDAPMILTRTPYDAKKRVATSRTPFAVSDVPISDQLYVSDGYIRIFQDVRGKYGSEGVFVMTRPVRGSLNPTTTDETTDAWDTLDWLSKNVPESNGRVGMLGSSYEGFTVVMALLDPHPALKVAAPESPMIDGWMGDDWFHYGAFRQNTMDFIQSETSARGDADETARDVYDDYEGFLRLGSAGDWARHYGLDKFPYMQQFEAHPAYDEFWQGQALDKLVAQHPSQVPTMWEEGLWDQEDMWGAIHSWSALKAAGHGDSNYLVIGPWRHSGANYDGSSLGELKFNGDTGLQWRQDTLKPFFDHYLKDAPKPDTPRAMIYNSGENHWDRFASWPLACESGCAAPLKPLYLAAQGGLSFSPVAAGTDSYVSDPAKPVPFMARPARLGDVDRWHSWLVQDQRFADGRPDVLTYQGDVLKAPMRISGVPVADIYAATSGTDSDWVVKLIDVYPDQDAARPEMSGYQLNLAMDIFRGRYRGSFAKPEPIPAGKTQHYRFTLPATNHVFLPGHRIMVQVQSSWFPLYDRNPQTYVANIFEAKPGDYHAATQTVARGGAEASAILLPLVPAQ